MPGSDVAARGSLPSATTRSEEPAGPTAGAIGQLRQMILGGELVPGQQLRQELMADQLGVSRPAVREALRQLTAEGLLTHTRNVGYMVARLSPDEFAQVYLMRKALEDVVIKSLPKPTKAQMREIEMHARAVVAAASTQNLLDMRFRNHDFHFSIFALSDLKLVVAELEKIWAWAAPYQATYLFSAEGRAAVLAEHDLIVQALRDGDNARLAELMDEHRRGSERHMGLTLGPSRLRG